MNYQSYVEFSGRSDKGGDADVVYYNASISNNNTADTGGSAEDPQVVFNDTRQSPLVRDSSDYFFSIVRFTMNGASKSLPLWIPRIQTPQPIISPVNNSVTITDSTGTFTFTVPEYADSLAAAVQSVLPPGYQCVAQGPRLRIFTTKKTSPSGPFIPFVLTIPAPSGQLAFEMGLVAAPGAYTSPSTTNLIGGFDYSVLGDRDLTVYSITLKGTIGGTDYTSAQTYLKWVPENANAALPLAPIIQQDFNTDYYYGYTYSHFCDMVNTAMGTAIADIATQAGAPVQTRTPVLSYDAGSKRFFWSFDARFWGTSATSPAPAGESWRLFMNINLESLLTNFQTTYFAGALNGLTNEVKVWPQAYSVDIDPTTGSPYSPPKGYVNFVITQDYGSTSGNWSPIDSIVFTSSLLPISAEQVGAPNVFGSDENTTGWSQPTSASAFQPVVTDIALGLDGADDYRQFIQYAPTAEYRMVAMAPSHQPISNIDFQVWWRNRIDNNLYPLRLYNGSAVNLKVMFRRIGGGV